MAKKIAAPARFALFGLFLLLLALSPSLNAAPVFSFTEYSYLLPEQNLSAWRYLLSGYSCDGFEKTLLYPTTVTNSREFSSTLSSLDAANHALAAAASNSRIQKASSAFSVIEQITPTMGAGSFVTYRTLSYLCFSDGGSALRHCTTAVKNSFKAIDENSEALDKMVSPEYEGMAGGVLAELGEVRTDVELRRSEGAGIGKQFVSRSDSSERVWSGFGLGQAASSELFNECDALAGRESLLSGLITLNDKIKRAIDSLEEEKTLLENEFEEKKFAAENALTEANGEKLYLVGENAFELVGSASVVSSEYGIESFENDLRNASNALAFAELKKSEASRVYSQKNEGYVSKSIIALRTAVVEEGEAISVTENVLERSEWLENALRQRVLSEQENTRKAIEANRLANPYAAAAAQYYFEKNYGELAARLATRGERIAFYLKEINELLSIQETASSSEGVRSEKNAVEALAAGLEKLIEKAEKDELEVDYEKKELADARQALARLGDGPEAVQQIYLLKRDLETLREGIIAQAQERYGFVLGKEFAEIRGLEPALTDSQTLYLSNAERFFNFFGELEAEKALGSLAETKDGFEKILADVDLRLPEILKKSLEDSARLTAQYEEAELGERTTLYAKIVFENVLPLSYPKQLLLENRELSELISDGFEVESKGDGVLGITQQGVLLQSVDENGYYEATAKSSKKITERLGEIEETVFANERLAEKKVTANFDSEIDDALVTVKKKLAFPATLVETDSQQDVLATDSRTNADGSTEFSALVQARKGRNSVSFYYEIASPIAVTKTFSASNSSLVFSYEFYSPYTDLSGVEVSVLEPLGCEPKDVSVSTDLKHEEETRERTLSVKFSATRFDARETKNAVATVQCDSLAAAAEERFTDVEALIAAWNATGEEKTAALALVDEASQKISSRDYAGALRALYEAEQIVLDSQEALAQAEAEALQREQTLARLAALENETQNYVYSLARDGFPDEADDLQKQLDEAREKISAGRLDEAETILENALEEMTRKKLLELQENCLEDTCPSEASDALNAAFGFLAVKDFGNALAKAGEAEEMLGEIASAKASEAQAKQILVKKVPSLKEDAEKIFGEFDSAFAVGDDLLKDRKKSLAFQEGNDARNRAEEIIIDLDEAWNSFETGDKKFDKISLDFLNASISEAERLGESLSEKIAETRNEAQNEIALAKARQKQFGDNETAKTLELAQNAFGKGNYFAALAYARQANSVLRGYGTAQAGDAGNDFAKILLGVVGIAILGVLVYAIVLKKPAPKKREI